MAKKSNKVNYFWRSYQNAVLGSEGAEKSAKWYVNWAQ